MLNTYEVSISGGIHTIFIQAVSSRDALDKYKKRFAECFHNKEYADVIRYKTDEDGFYIEDNSGEYLRERIN
jgi:hypothetical protein